MIFLSLMFLFQQTYFSFGHASQAKATKPLEIKSFCDFKSGSSNVRWKFLAQLLCQICPHKTKSPKPKRLGA